MTPLSIIHTESSLGWGGQEIRILTEAAGMISRGHTVRLLCPREARIFEEAARYSVPVESLPIGRKNLKGLISMRGWIGAHPPRQGWDVINTHSSTDSWLVALALLLSGRAAPIVRTRHISAPVPRNRLSAWLYGSAAAQIVTTGEALRSQLILDNGVAPERIQSIPTGVDIHRFMPGDRAAARAKIGLPVDRTLVGIVATLRSWKGHRFLIDACASLPLNVGLVIVGDGPQREALQAMVASKGLGDRVWMAGNQVDVVPWLQAIDIFALPSYANEGVPQALLQAMLVALPVVTTSAGSIGELAFDGKTALVVPSQDVQALRDSLARLISDANLRVRLGSAAREFCVERYSLEHMLDRMEAVFRSVAPFPCNVDSGAN